MTTLCAESGGNPGSPWVLHDLRRTAAIIMARNNVAPYVADKVLNHSVGTGAISGVAAVYTDTSIYRSGRWHCRRLGVS
jgi:hypothetical protein